MSLFYAYIKSTVNNENWRFSIVFANRDVADEWWRAVSTSTNAIITTGNIQRITPQFYTHSNPNAILSQFTALPQFLNTVFFTLLFDGGGRSLDVLPVQSITDHVSGNSFFIRSKVEPYEYWYCPEGGDGNITRGTTVYASRQERTRFRVKLADPGDGTKTRDGTIMIGTDDIIISPASATDISVGVNDSGNLTVGSGNCACLKLGYLKSHFIGGTRPLVLQNETVRQIRQAQDGMGQEWELA